MPQQLNAVYQNGKIVKILWEMKKNGKANATIKNVGKALRVLDRSCNLDNPEEVKTFIATLDRKNGYKNHPLLRLITTTNDDVILQTIHNESHACRGETND